MTPTFFASQRPALFDQPRATLTLDIWKDIMKAQALYDAGDWDACEPIIRKMLRKKPFQSSAMSYDALGSCAQFQGRMEMAIACFRKALTVDPSYVEARNRIIMILDAQPVTTIGQAQRERDKWWTQHGEHLYANRIPHENDRDPERPLRVGYVSGDFQFHSAATVFHRIALRHSEAVTPFFYSSTPYNKYDTITNSYRVMPGWRDVVDWPDGLLAHKIRDDRIDILIDLSGYTSHNRLAMFCMQPAPIQASGWGYATGVGWKAMTHLMADRYVLPVERQHEHVESIIYLPCVISYEDVEGMPGPNPLPCLTERPTFGVFQRSLKLNAEFLELCRQVLARLPESRLLMKSHYCPSLRAWMQSCFGAQWPQVEIEGVTSSYEHKVGYQRVDLCLDPWPQTAGVSACDALCRGVPAVTLLGPRVIQRTTASLLTLLGLPEFITETPADYVEQAVQWVTTRKEELAAIRLELPERFKASPIQQGYTEATEQAFREVWREWCATPVSIADARKRLERWLAA